MISGWRHRASFKAPLRASLKCLLNCTPGGASSRTRSSSSRRTRRSAIPTGPCRRSSDASLPKAVPTGAPQNDLIEISTQPHSIHTFEQVSVWQDRDADGGDPDLRAGRQRRLNDNGTRENVPLRGTAEKWSRVKYSLNNSFMN